MTLEELKYLLNKNNLTPNKLRGQNFLISDEVLDDIVPIAQVKKNDLVMEVGPGVGALTARLLEHANRVAAFEVDKNFSDVLEKLSAVHEGRLEIFWQDILSLTDEQWAAYIKLHGFKDYKIVANIPYYLTAKFIQKFISARYKPKSMTLMVQNEVAQRIEAKNKKQSMLSLSVAFYAVPKLVRHVDKNSFYPVPKVDSAIIHIEDIKTWGYPVEERLLWQLVHRGFAQKRKKLANNLQSDQGLEKAAILEAFDKIGLDKNVRAENLQIRDWVELGKILLV